MARDELGDAQPVSDGDGFHAERAPGTFAEEAHLGLGAKVGGEQVWRLAEDPDEPSLPGLQQVKTPQQMSFRCR
jgi:hypothetical protein